MNSIKVFSRIRAIERTGRRNHGRKPRALLRSIFDSGVRNGLPIDWVSDYSPCDLLVLYGWGGELQQGVLKRHRSDYLAFDLGYWNRDGFEDRKWRISINGFHCPDRIMKGPTPSDKRFRDEGIELSRARPRKNKSILLIGNAPKSVRVGAQGWTAQKSRELRKVFPDHRIIYRPKPQRGSESNVSYHEVFKDGSIESAIARSSLVVCRHSNVAVDACRLGVPVVCEDGAAASIYPNKLKDFKDQPTFDQRKEFLIRLAWWQWSIREIKQGGFWEWAQNELAR